LLAKIRKKSETANLRDENTEIKKNGLNFRPLFFLFWFLDSPQLRGPWMGRH
jgi:hypothetical protein